MRNKIGIVFLGCISFALFCHGFASAGRRAFDSYFTSGALRMDYMHKGDSQSSSVEFLAWKSEPFWGGPKNNLIAQPLKGEFVVEVLDPSNGALVFSRGFSSLFYEWQSTSEALKTTKSFYESVVMPFPKQAVKVRLSRRDKKHRFHVLFEGVFDPLAMHAESTSTPPYKVEKLFNAGNPSHFLDLVFLPEGYTLGEMEKFRNDVADLMSAFFSWSPYDEYRGLINIWIVEAPSRQSGTDIPHKGIWKDTILNSGFDTFGIERYLTTADYKAVRDLASLAPYDQICIMVNSGEYGGAGIYNFYTLFTADNQWSEFLFMHEFGHGFVGLADEYYSSEVPYNDMFDMSVEPYQENITTLVDFESKWKDMISPQTPVPTPDEPMYFNAVGVFEGAAYQAKGMYRPFHDCTMKSKSINNFCPVCQRAIRRAVESNMALYR